MPCAFHSRRPPLQGEAFHNGSRQARRSRKSKTESPLNEIFEESRNCGAIAPGGGAPSPEKIYPKRRSPPDARKHPPVREAQRGPPRSRRRAGSADLYPLAKEKLVERGSRCQRW